MTIEEIEARGWKIGGKSQKNRYCFVLPDGMTPAVRRRSKAEIMSALKIPTGLAYPDDEVSPNGYTRRTI